MLKELKYYWNLFNEKHNKKENDLFIVGFVSGCFGCILTIIGIWVLDLIAYILSTA